MEVTMAKKVTLGEALQNRKHVVAQVGKLVGQMGTDSFGWLRQDRATGNILQPELPEHDTVWHLAVIGSAVDAVTNLVTKIDLANARTTIEYRNKIISLSEALVLRENWKSTAELITAAIPSKDANRVIFADVSKMRDIANTFAREAREIDVLIQEANWRTYLEE
jgi:hypothetical protein